MKSAFVVILLSLASCSQSRTCDESQAYNKMLALGKVQGRLAADGGAVGTSMSAALGVESGKVSELIAQKKYEEACQMAEGIAKKLEINLAEEQKNMITFEQLAKDGGKGSGTCSIADAAKKQMDVHGLLQAEVDAGRRSTDVFQQFNDDTKSYAELLSTDPSAACKLMDDLKTKYKL